MTDEAENQELPSDHRYRGDGCLSCERADAYSEFWKWFEPFRQQKDLFYMSQWRLAWAAFQAGWRIPVEDQPDPVMEGR